MLPRNRLSVVVLVLLAAAPAWADFRLEREFPLAPGGRFVLESDLGAVTVNGSDRSGARVLITSRRDDIEDRVDFRFEESAGEVRIRAEKIGRRWLSSLFGGSNEGSLHFEIEVPAATELEIRTGGGAIRLEGTRGDAELQTSGGRIRVQDTEGHLRAQTSGGAIDLMRVRGDARASTSGGAIEAVGIEGSLEVRTSGGPISVEEVGGDLVAKTSGGSIRIEEAGGKVEASTSGGSVGVVFATGNRSGGSLSSSGGSIRVEMDPDAAIDLDAHTSGGTVTCDLPVTVRGKMERGTLRGQIGQGGEMLRIRTSGGSIRISAR